MIDATKKCWSMPPPLPPLELRNISPIGKCIYCERTDNLTTEHIVPRGMKGTVTLPKGSCTELLADKGYDTDAIRAFLKEQGIKPVIPGKSNRKKKIRYDKKAYKNGNVVERCFCRLKEFRRIGTRYDKLAQNFFSALCFAATLAYWI